MRLQNGLGSHVLTEGWYLLQLISPCNRVLVQSLSLDGNGLRHRQCWLQDGLLAAEGLAMSGRCKALRSALDRQDPRPTQHSCRGYGAAGACGSPIGCELFQAEAWSAAACNRLDDGKPVQPRASRIRSVARRRGFDTLKHSWRHRRAAWREQTPA